METCWHELIWFDSIYIIQLYNYTWHIIVLNTHYHNDYSNMYRDGYGYVLVNPSHSLISWQAAYQKIANPCPRVKAESVVSFLQRLCSNMFQLSKFQLCLVMFIHKHVYIKSMILRGHSPSDFPYQCLTTWWYPFVRYVVGGGQLPVGVVESSGYMTENMPVKPSENPLSKATVNAIKHTIPTVFVGRMLRCW